MCAARFDFRVQNSCFLEISDDLLDSLADSDDRRSSFLLSPKTGLDG
jgi:hypothetical protein